MNIIRSVGGIQNKAASTWQNTSRNLPTGDSSLLVGCNWGPCRQQTKTALSGSAFGVANLYIAYRSGAGDRYREIAARYLKDDSFFTPLSEGKNVLPGNHAYSHCNSLSSAMQAYLVDGSTKHLRAASNAFDMIQATQSFASGGWGPNETFVNPGKGDLARSLNDSHKSFETPCGAYAHFKLARYLLRVTANPRYGDSLEQVFYNTVLGAKPLMPDGRGFYYSDYNFSGQKYYRYAWTCCTGSLPQLVCDYHVSGYFRDAEGIFVNLYLPSTLKFTHKNTELTLKQVTEYPFDTKIKFELASDKPVEFKMSLRIPGWVAEPATLLINGKSSKMNLAAGKFAEIDRTWNNGDTIELTLPMSLRLVPIAPENQDIVALMHGPLALFAILEEEKPAPTPTHKQLFAAQRTARDEWQMQVGETKTRFRPFTSIDKETYSLYLKTNS